MLQVLKNIRVGKRYYHSDNVFGFKRKVTPFYIVDDETVANRCRESNFYRLVTAYRQHAHKSADINPVSIVKTISLTPELDLKQYGLNDDTQVSFKGILHHDKDKGTVAEGLDFLKNVYGKNLTAEFMHLENGEEADWFAKNLEETYPHSITKERKLKLNEDLLKSQTFDNFLAKKFTNVKRYGGEGAESIMAFFGELFNMSAEANLNDVVIACPHRGRLNLLTGMLNFPPVKMFSKLRGNSIVPRKYQCSGDVLSHCIASTDLKFDNKSVHISLLYNPSHLEAVNPVSMGKTRAKQLKNKDGDYGDNQQWSDKVLNLQVHGDAAIIGQGVNQECLALSGTPHFEIGGTIHLVVNNQVGFTTPAERGRSSRYCTDLAKIISAPVIHVNGDYPELVLAATKLAFDYHRRFRKDVFLDLNCYRQWGHNELDDPTFTNPSLYGVIRNRGTVPDRYADHLIKEGIITEPECKAIVDNHWNWLNEQLKAVDNYVPEDVHYKNEWQGFGQPSESITTWDTGIDMDLMTFIGAKSVKTPQNFEIHPTILRGHVKNRLAKIAEGTNIDWSTAEAIAIGSLLFEGNNVRISGQDVGRATFANRHAMLVDQQSNTIYIPLNSLHPNQTAFLEIANSILSEEAVLGYEYGMSVESPHNLIIWEAQFGDFFNGAQIIFDTFITSGETKWLWSSGLVCLLPHGYDGAGPEHSSAKIERFLQLTDSTERKVDSDNVNMQVCQPSTPAQYFHLLRRQMVRNFRKPLIIITPKTLLRDPACVSSFGDMAKGTSFLPVIGDRNIDPNKVKRVLLTSGKHYYSLCNKKTEMGISDTAIVRLESFCPFPTLELRHEISKYRNAKMIIWCQEEPQNMGAWTFVNPRFTNLIGRKIQYCGRASLATPAVGISKVHQEEVSKITTEPFLMEENDV